MGKIAQKKLQTIFCSKFVDHIPKIRQTKPEKLKKRPKIRHRSVMLSALQLLNIYWIVNQSFPYDHSCK